jgi:hypothetical protein
LIPIAIALALAAAPAYGVCALEQLSDCLDTAQLVQDPAFAPALRRFVGDRRTGFLVQNGEASREALMALSGPADPARMMGDLFLFTACRDKSCEEKGAAVVRRDGAIVAVAVLHSDCARMFPAKDCFLKETLSVFAGGSESDKAVIDQLSDWARRQVAAQAASPGAPSIRLQRVEVLAANGAPEQAAVQTAPPPAPAALPRVAAAVPPPVIQTPTEPPLPPQVEPPRALPPPEPAAPPAVLAQAEPAASLPPPAAISAGSAAPQTLEKRTVQAPAVTPAAEEAARPATPVSEADVVAAVVRQPHLERPPAPILISTLPVPPTVIPILPPVPKKEKPKSWRWKWSWTPYGEAYEYK